MIKAFFGNRSIVLLFLPVLLGIYFLCNHYSHYYIYGGSINGGFWGQIEIPELISQLSAMGLVLLNSLLINRIFNRNEFMSKNTYLPSLLFLVVMSNFHVFFYLNGLGIAITIMILMIVQLFTLRQNEDGRRAIFNAAFLFGAASTFYPLLMFCIPVFFWLIWVIRPFFLRESALAIVGYIVPLAYAGGYTLFVKTPLSSEYLSSSSHNFVWQSLIINVGLILFMIFISMPPTLNKIKLSGIRLKKLLRIILLSALLGMVTMTIELLFLNKVEGASLMAIPLIFLLTYGFGVRELRKSAVFFFYVFFFFSVGKFFIPLDF